MSFAHRFLLSIPAELAHDMAIHMLPFVPVFHSLIDNPVDLMGIRFKNRVGLAAGLDKDGRALSAWHKMGFGSVEIGTVTPLPQAGNPKPRLFRIPEKKAIINRMGFNNKGIDNLLQNLAEYRLNNSHGPKIGVNIGKNAKTPIERAVDDYCICLQKAYQLADYITINISSPNTQNLRLLQGKEQLQRLLETLKNEQSRLESEYRKKTPLIVKIAPDMLEHELLDVISVIQSVEIDGVIATNTTLDRNNIKGLINAEQAGGLSGTPLTDKSTEILSILTRHLSKDIPVIASGGVMSGEDAVTKIKAGAELVQIYTGFIYNGMKLIDGCNNEIISYLSTLPFHANNTP